LQKVIREVTEHLENFRFSEYVKTIYNFFWSEFCDWYIELSKPRLSSTEDPESKLIAQVILWRVLKESMQLLHPVMPFITEEIWQKLPSTDESIMISKWPEPNESLIDEEAERDMIFLMDSIRSIRAIRSEFNILPNEVINVEFSTPNKYKEVLLQGYSGYFYTLAKAKLSSTLEKKDLKHVAHKIVEDVNYYVNLEGLIDINKEREKVKKEIDDVSLLIEKIEKRLSDKNFIEKAPTEVVEKEKEKLENLKKKFEFLQERYKTLE